VETLSCQAETVSAADKMLGLIGGRISLVSEVPSRQFDAGALQDLVDRQEKLSLNGTKLVPV
jgi:hypothetical protein